MKTYPHLRPRQSLGQNFLRDDNVARKIVGAVSPGAGDTILEIGPGEGALTKHLLATPSRLVAIDLDERVIERLRKDFPEGGFELLHGDILEMDLEALATRYGRIRVLGNIPYNITTPILFHVLDHRSAVVDATLLMQREVARRIVARPGSKDYGILSVLCQLFSEVDVLFDVSPNVFYPRPEVTSSLLRMRTLNQPRYPLHNESFVRTFVRAAFGKRRKMLRNSLGYLFGDRATLPDHPDLQRRPEDLTIAELVALANACSHLPIIASGPHHRS